MADRFLSLKKDVDKDIKDALDSNKNTRQHGLFSQASKKLDDLRDKYQKVLEQLKVAKTDMTGVNHESNFEFRNINSKRMDAGSIGDISYSAVNFRAEDGTEVNGTNGVKTIPEMAERLSKIKNTVFRPRGSDSSKRNRFQCEYELNQTSFFWKKMDFQELFIGSPMAQLEFLFYMMMCYDSRDVTPTYDPESAKMFGLNMEADKPNGRVTNGSIEGRFAGPTLRLPDEYRALAKCMMKESDEKKYLVRYGIPFGEHTNNSNVDSAYDRTAGKYAVKWIDSDGDSIYPDIQFDVGQAGREGGAHTTNTTGGQIAGIIQYYNLNGDGTDGLHMPREVGAAASVIGGHANEHLDHYYENETSYVRGNVNNITLSMRGLNRRGFDSAIGAGNNVAAAGVAAKNYESPFLPTLTTGHDFNRQHIHVVSNTKGFNVFNVNNWGPATARVVPAVTGLNGNYNDNTALPGLNSIQNRYILTGGSGNVFRYRDSFSGDHTGSSALDAVKRGAIFGAYFGEPCLDDNSLQMTVGGHEINNNNNDEGAGDANNHIIPNIFLRRFRTDDANDQENDDRRYGNRNSNAGYVFDENTINYDEGDVDKFGTNNTSVKESWADEDTGLAAGKGFIGNERGIGTTTYSTSRLSLLYDIVYSNPFGATNPVGDNSRGYVDMMHCKRRAVNLKEGEAPGHICTPRDFYVKCVLGRYVMFWNQDGTPAEDCWDQEYFPAPGCVKQIFGNANSEGDYVGSVDVIAASGKVTATILDRALPKVVHYAGRKVPKPDANYTFSGRGVGDDAYCDYDGAKNRGVRDASGAYSKTYTAAGAVGAGKATDFGTNSGAPGNAAADDRIIVPTEANTPGLDKKQGNFGLKDAQKTILTNFFCGNFSAAYQGTAAWDSMYQFTANSGLAQYDGGYKTNQYLQTAQNDHNQNNYLEIDNHGDTILGRYTLAPQFNTAGNNVEFLTAGNATNKSAFVYNKMSGTVAGVNPQYQPVSGVAPFNNFRINITRAVVDAQDGANVYGVMKYITGAGGTQGLPTTANNGAAMNNIIGGGAPAPVPAAGITTGYGDELKKQGYCRYNLPGAQLSNSTTGAMFNAYRGLFSPTNIPTNVEIFAFCHNFAKMIFNNLDEEKYPVLKDSVAGRESWTNRMATKMAASICKIRELLFTDDLSDAEVLKGLVPTDPADYASNVPEKNKLGLVSVNDGLPGGDWKKLFIDGGSPRFNGIISNPKLRQAVINVINKMIVSRGEGFSGSSSLSRNIKYEKPEDLRKRAVRFTSEGILRKSDDGIDIRQNFNAVGGGAKTAFNLIKRDVNNNVTIRESGYLPADCGRCDYLTTIDMGELYGCNLMVDESFGKLYLFDYIQTRLAEQKGYIAKGTELSPWITGRDYYKNLNIAKYGGMYKAPSYGGIIQQYVEDGTKTSFWTVSNITKHFADLIDFWDEMIHSIQSSIGQEMLKLDQARLAEYQNNLNQIRDIFKGFIDSLALGDEERIEQDKQLIEMTFTQHLDNVRQKQSAIENGETKLRGLKGKVHEIRLKATKIGSGTFLHSDSVKNQLRNVADDAKNIKAKIEENRFEKKMASELVYEYFKIIDQRLGKAENRGTTGQYSKEIRDEILFIKKRLENMAITALGSSWKEGLEKGFSVLDQLASKPEMARRVADLKRYGDILKKDFNGGLWVPVAYKRLLGKKIGLLNILTGIVLPDWDDLSKRTEFKGRIIVTASDLKSEWYYMLPPDGEFPPKRKGVSVVDEEVLKAYRLKLFTGYMSMQSAAMRVEASALQSHASTGVNRAIWWATNGVKCGKGSVGKCPTKEVCASQANDPRSPCGGVTTMAEAVTVIRRTVLADERFERSALVSRLTTMNGGRKGGRKSVRTLSDKILDDLMKQFDL